MLANFGWFPYSTVRICCSSDRTLESGGPSDAGKKEKKNGRGTLPVQWTPPPPRSPDLRVCSTRMSIWSCVGRLINKTLIGVAAC